ncbi:hypothetical protein PFISCL1PPCAC_10837, partial [Pristionchus fissidentatus]
QHHISMPFSRPSSNSRAFRRSTLSLAGSSNSCTSNESLCSSDYEERPEPSLNANRFESSQEINNDSTLRFELSQDVTNGSILLPPPNVPLWEQCGLAPPKRVPIDNTEKRLIDTSEMDRRYQYWMKECIEMTKDYQKMTEKIWNRRRESQNEAHANFRFLQEKYECVMRVVLHTQSRQRVQKDFMSESKKLDLSSIQ